jgi:hypothetical protein
MKWTISQLKKFMKLEQKTTKGATEEKLETKPEPAQDWAEILYDPRTDLDLLDLDKNEFHLEEQKRPDSLMKKMHLFGKTNKDEEFNFPQCQSSTEININLNSENSRLRKIGILFMLCRNILQGLKEERFKENKKLLLFHFFSFGIVNLLLRILSADIYIILGLPPPHAVNTGFKCLLPDTEFLVYIHLRFDDRFENLAPGAAQVVDGFSIKNHALISLADFKAVITRQLPDMSYEFFVKNYVTRFQQILHLINSEEYLENIKKKTVHDPDRFDKAVKFFKAMKEPFLEQKTRILKEERELLFDNFKFFPVALEKIIHQYADSRAFCFFTPERETEPLIHDHNYPEPEPELELQSDEEEESTSSATRWVPLFGN